MREANASVDRMVRRWPELTEEQIKAVRELAQGHKRFRMWREKSTGRIMFSREAMYTPTVREPFYIT